MKQLNNPEERIVELQKLYRSSLLQGKEFAELKAIKTQIRELREYSNYTENSNNNVTHFSKHFRSAEG